MKYLDKELRKNGYDAYPPCRRRQGSIVRLYAAGNMHIHVCYEETALGTRVESIDLLDCDDQRYVATTRNNELFKYAIPLEDFIRIIQGPPSGIVMRLENETNRKVLEALE